MNNLTTNMGNNDITFTKLEHGTSTVIASTSRRFNYV